MDLYLRAVPTTAADGAQPPCQCGSSQNYGGLRGGKGSARTVTVHFAPLMCGPTRRAAIFGGLTRPIVTHEALHDRPPATLYRPSPRAYTGTLPPVEYPGHFIVKRVTNAGTIRLRKRLLFLANALKQHPVGLEEIDDGIWSIHFCHVLLGRVDERDYIIQA